MAQDNVQWQSFVNRVSLTQVYLDVVDDCELLTQGVQFDRGGEAFTGLFFFLIFKIADICRLHSANNFDLSKYVLVLENMSEHIKEEINTNYF